MKNQKYNVVFIDPELEDLIPQFIQNQKKHLEFIKAAHNVQNYKDIKVIGHQMKGSCGGYGFFELSKLGAKLEFFAQEQNSKLLLECINELENYLSNLSVSYEKE